MKIQIIAIVSMVVIVTGCTSKEHHQVSETAIISPMVKIIGGCFTMGSESASADEDEFPEHEVCVDDFEIDAYEATQRAFTKIMGGKVKFLIDCPKCPADFVSWADAKDFCEKQGKRLPTEAEWEYAAKAGTDTEFYWGDEVDKDYLWYFDNAEVQTHAVGMKKPNAYGLYDMSGNVWEWVSDFYDEKYFKESPKMNPTGPETGKRKVSRGGSWEYKAKYQRSTNRRRAFPDFKLALVGCRCVK